MFVGSSFWVFEVFNVWVVIFMLCQMGRTHHGGWQRAHNNHISADSQAYLGNIDEPFGYYFEHVDLSPPFESQEDQIWVIQECIKQQIQQ